MYCLISLQMPTITLTVRHNYLEKRFSEVRFDTKLTIREVKQKLCAITGTAPRDQRLLLRRGLNDVIVLSDGAVLGDYSPEPGMELEVYDRNPYSIVREIGQRDWRDMPTVVASD